MDKKKIKKITKILKKNKNYIEEKDNIIEYLNNGYYTFSDDFLYELIEFIIKNELSIKVIEKAKELYNIIIFNNSEIEKELFFKFFSYFTKNEDKEINNFKVLYNLFKNKKLIYYIYLDLKQIEDYYILKVIYNYILKSKNYYIDEKAHYFRIKEFILMASEIKCHPDIDKIILEFLEIDKQILGIYDVDKEKIEDLFLKSTTYKNTSKNIKEKINRVLSKINLVEEKLKQENNDDKLKQIKALYKKTEDLIKEDISYDNKKNDNEINRKLDIIIDKLNKMDKNNGNKKITKELLTTPEIDASIILNEVKKNLSRKYNLEENKKSDAIFKETIKELFNKYDRETLLNSKLFKLDDNISLKYANFKIKDNMKDNLLQYKLNFSLLEVYYFALKEKSEKLLLKVILKQGFKNISLLCFFEKKYVSVFDEEEYINLIANNPTTLFIFISTETKENIHTLKNILKINPNFIFNYSSFDLFEDALEVFGIEIIAKNDEILEENIENCDLCDLNILKEIYEINPKFKLSSSFDLEKAKKVFSTEEISSLNIDKQRNFDYYIDEILKNKEFFKKVFLSNSESYFSPNLPKIINKFNISLDEYLSLNYEDSDKLVDAYKSNLSTFFEYGPEVIVDYVRDNYHAKKVLKKIGDSHEKK